MRCFFSALLLFAAIALQAQVPVRPEFDVQFHAAVVNNEFDASSSVLAPSLTIAAVRVAPYAGFVFGKDGTHRLKTGVNLAKDFGTAGDPVQAEWAIWYQMNRPVFSMAMGIFPRSLLRGRYSTAILSDKVRYYDTLLDGFLLQWRKGRSSYEVALDWNGKFARERREQFNVITAGEGWLTPWLSLNWEGMFHHYANSETVRGVVDDIFIHPYAKADFSAGTVLDKLTVEAGVMAGYQHDRARGDLRIPVGGDLVVDIAKWGVGLRNEAYYGGSQAPFFSHADAAGKPYGTALYIRSSLWQVTPDGRPGFYDRTDLYWAPRIADGVRIRLCLTAHFGYGGFLGTQQIGEVLVNLDRLFFKGRDRK